MIYRMSTFLLTTQIIFAILLSILILMQNKGTGLSETFGGESNVYTTKRGAEKFLHIATIVLGVLLVLNTLAFAFVM